MKTSLLTQIAFLSCALGVSGFTAANAQDTGSTTSTNTPPPSGSCHQHGGVLTKDEWQELKKDREQVFTSNPDLKAEGEALHKQFIEHQKKVDEAIEQVDPNAEALIAKLKAAHHHKHHSDAGATSSPS